MASVAPPPVRFDTGWRDTLRGMIYPDAVPTHLRGHARDEYRDGYGTAVLAVRNPEAGDEAVEDYFGGDQ